MRAASGVRYWRAVTVTPAAGTRVGGPVEMPETCHPTFSDHSLCWFVPVQSSGVTTLVGPSQVTFEAMPRLTATDSFCVLRTSIEQSTSAWAGAAAPSTATAAMAGISRFDLMAASLACPAAYGNGENPYFGRWVGNLPMSARGARPYGRRMKRIALLALPVLLIAVPAAHAIPMPRIYTASVSGSATVNATYDRAGGCAERWTLRGEPRSGQWRLSWRTTRPLEVRKRWHPIAGLNEILAGAMLPTHLEQSISERWELQNFDTGCHPVPDDCADTRRTTERPYFGMATNVVGQRVRLSVEGTSFPLDVDSCAPYAIDPAESRARLPLVRWVPVERFESGRPFRVRRAASRRIQGEGWSGSVDYSVVWRLRPR